MQGPQDIYFAPDPNAIFKVISVVDPNKAFTLQDQTHKLVINDYAATPNQLFKIFRDNLNYAFVNPATDSALHV